MAAAGVQPREGRPTKDNSAQDTIMRLRRHTIVAVIGIAGLLGSCEQKALAPAANAGESRQAAAAPPPAPAAPPAVVTPRTESPDVAKNLSKAFAATAKALAPSVVRSNVRGGRPPIAERDSAFVATAFDSNGPAFLLTAIEPIWKRVVCADVIQLRCRLVVP